MACQSIYKTCWEDRDRDGVSRKTNRDRKLDLTWDAAVWCGVDIFCGRAATCVPTLWILEACDTENASHSKYRWIREEKQGKKRGGEKHWWREEKMQAQVSPKRAEPHISPLFPFAYLNPESLDLGSNPGFLTTEHIFRKLLIKRLAIRIYLSRLF